MFLQNIIKFKLLLNNKFNKLYSNFNNPDRIKIKSTHGIPGLEMDLKKYQKFQFQFQTCSLKGLSLFRATYIGLASIVL